MISVTLFERKNGMNLNTLNETYKNCSCGKDHSCPIDDVVIGKGAINELVRLCGNYRNILLVCDENTYKVCGKAVSALLGEKIGEEIVLLPNGDVVIPNEEKIAEIEAKIADKTDLILGVGSGVINDLCKHTSFQHNIDYFIVATAPSMDGYASVGAALILSGMKVTLNARPPKAIVADTDVLKHAPLEMLQAGYGDIIGKYSCLNDWKLSTLVNDEYFCKAIYDLVYAQADKIRNYASDILEKKDDAVAALMEALVVVGIAMSYVGNSRPASGSEHHLSHFFEITGILEGKPYYSHGIDVMYSAAVTAKIREEILSSVPEKKAFCKDAWETEIRRIYTASAEEVIALQDKLGWYEKEDAVIEKQEEIKEILKEAPTFSENVSMLSEIGLSYEEFLAFYGEDKIKDAMLYAKDLKDRYSVLWLYERYFK